MGRFLLLLIIVGQAFGIACSLPQHAQTVVQRRPLEKQQREYKSPVKYSPRDVGYDPKTGELITYDHKPRVELLDAKSGKYAFKWIGYDGEEKMVVYQRPDTIDVVVSGSVSRTPEGVYLYSYKVENLPSSGVELSGFIVQNNAPDTKPVEVNGTPTNLEDINLLDAFRHQRRDGSPPNLPDFHIGQMSSHIEQFKEGGWIHFGMMPSLEPQITPGKSLEVKLLSSAPPGVVECRAFGGPRIIKGVGEHVPMVLGNMLPGYEGLPRGYTIGPVDDMNSLSRAERIKYLLDRLPQFLKLGWMTQETSRRYERHLKSGDLKAISKHVERDLKAEEITTEVFGMIRSVE